MNTSLDSSTDFYFSILKNIQISPFKKKKQSLDLGIQQGIEQLSKANKDYEHQSDIYVNVLNQYEILFKNLNHLTADWERAHLAEKTNIQLWKNAIYDEIESLKAVRIVFRNENSFEEKISNFQNLIMRCKNKELEILQGKQAQNGLDNQINLESIQKLHALAELQFKNYEDYKFQYAACKDLMLNKIRSQYEKILLLNREQISQINNKQDIYKDLINIETNKIFMLHQAEKRLVNSKKFYISRSYYRPHKYKYRTYFNESYLSDKFGCVSKIHFFHNNSGISALRFLYGPEKYKGELHGTQRPWDRKISIRVSHLGNISEVKIAYGSKYKNRSNLIIPLIYYISLKGDKSKWKFGCKNEANKLKTIYFGPNYKLSYLSGRDYNLNWLILADEKLSGFCKLSFGFKNKILELAKSNELENKVKAASYLLHESNKFLGA